MKCILRRVIAAAAERKAAAAITASPHNPIAATIIPRPRHHYMSPKRWEFRKPFALTRHFPKYPYTFYPQKCYKIFPVFFLQKFSPFWHPQVGIESVSETANIFPVFYTKIFPVSETLFVPISDTLFIPVSVTLLFPFPIRFLSRFRYPFYPRFQFPFIPVSDTLFIPISDTLLSPFLFPPFPEPFLPPPPMLPCPQRQNRTQQRICSSPLVSGHKSYGR